MPVMLRILMLAVIFAPLFAGEARAAEKTFIIAPFAVNAPQSYNYLSKAVPGTIQGRLNKPGVLTGKAAAGKAGEAEVRRAMKNSGADFGVWGVINVMGKDATVEVNSVDKNGKTWSRSATGTISSLTGTVQNLAAALGSEVMGVSAAAAPAFMTPGSRAASGSAARPGSDIIVNETGQQQVYLNPQFRYQGAGANDGSRLRSQRIDHNMVDMALGDFNGDGKTEIAVIGDTTLAIYLWDQGGRLKKLGERKVSQSNNNFSMRAMDLNRDGATDLVIATFEEESNRPYSYFISFKGNQFSEVAPRIPYFASVLRVPPSFELRLVGQGFDSVRMFSPGVHDLVKQNGKYVLGGRIGLPSGANVFNVSWIPDGNDKKGDLLIMLTDDEKIKVFAGNGSKPIHTSMERFSGSATGMDFYKTVPGLGTDKRTQLPGKYYSPMRMIAADIGHTGENVLLLNKPISTASQFFDRYRFFPQGEVHALYWDGVGMGLKWKTRRIRGSVAEIDLGDVNNDGITDLVVGINTSPELGVGSRQSMITAYPLDTSRADPNTPADMSDFEVTPNN